MDNQSSAVPADSVSSADDRGRNADWLVGGGEMGERIRSTDWAATPLGPREHWPEPLRTAVRLIVESRFPMALLWSPDLLLLYNDAYQVIAADRHPDALGRPTREVWSEVWHINEPLFAAVMERGESLFFEDMLFPIARRGQLEDAYFTLSYSPVRLENGSVAGTLVALQETTAAVEGNRRVRESEARLAAIHDGLPFAVALTRMPDGRIVSANDAFLKLFEFTREEAIGRTRVELGISRAEDQEQELAELREHGRVRDLEVRRSTRTGTPLRLSLNLDCVTVASQTYVLATAPNITEQRARHAEREQRERTRLLETLASHHPALTAVIRTSDLRILYVNHAFRERFADAELLDGTVDDVWPMNAPAFAEHCRAMPSASGAIHVSDEAVRVRRAPAEAEAEAHFSWSLIRVASEGGDLLLYVALETTRRMINMRMMEYQSELLDQANDAIVASDESFRITAWNRAAERLYGWSAAEVVGQDGVGVLKTEWAGRVGDEIRRGIAEAGFWRGEATQQHRDGTRFPVEVATKVLRRDDGSVRGYVSVNRDTSERKATDGSAARERGVASHDALQHRRWRDRNRRAGPHRDHEPCRRDAHGLVRSRRQAEGSPGLFFAWGIHPRCAAFGRA